MMEPVDETVCKGAVPGEGKGLTIALAGNPNCGKSALFNALTGIRQTTGNWPGVTVERKEGRLELDGRQIRVIDLPGIYSLDAGSLDELVTRDYLLSRDANLIVNVVDATNQPTNQPGAQSVVWMPATARARSSARSAARQHRCLRRWASARTIGRRCWASFPGCWPRR